VRGKRRWVEGVIDPVVFQYLNRAIGKRLKWYKEKVWEDVLRASKVE
jgi:hypothetical protein